MKLVALLFQGHLPKYFWYLINRTCIALLKLFQVQPSYKHLKVFGCLGFASTHFQKPSKLMHVLRSAFSLVILWPKEKLPLSLGMSSFLKTIFPSLLQLPPRYHFHCPSLSTIPTSPTPLSTILMTSLPLSLPLPENHHNPPSFLLTCTQGDNSCSHCRVCVVSSHEYSAIWVNLNPTFFSKRVRNPQS